MPRQSFLINNPPRALQLALVGALIAFTLQSGATSANAIVRVSAPPDVGTHVFNADLGISGSLEEVTGGEDLAWSLGWTYHANNSLGIGLSAGSNRPESFAGSLFSQGSRTDGFFENKFEFVTANIHVRAPTRAGFIPHLQAGFGIYQIDFNFTPLTPGEFSQKVEQSEFGMHYGVGLDYLVSKNIAVGVIGNYHLISMDRSFVITDVLGDWHKSWDIRAGFSFYTH